MIPTSETGWISAPKGPVRSGAVPLNSKSGAERGADRSDTLTDQDITRQPGTVLVTGGAGFTGINLIRFLLEKGVKVRSLDLAEFDYADCRDRIEHFVGDIRDPDAVARAMVGCDLVVHGAMALPLYSEHDIMTTGVDGTRTVLQAALDAGVGRVVHISSTAVYGVPDHHPLVEDDPMIGVGPYGQAKIEAEGVCGEYRDQGLVVPVLRPKSFIGPERLGVFALLY
ncbi:hypothetical protein DRQ50_14490, partial [bacterium]